MPAVAIVVESGLMSTPWMDADRWLGDDPISEPSKFHLHTLESPRPFTMKRAVW